MADHPSTNHPPIPGTKALGWFAIFLFVFFVGLTLFLQLKFGHPAP